MNQERLMQVLQAPHLSEKSSNLGDAHNQVVFKVVPDATKREVSQAVELMFDVKVTNVTTINVKGKRSKFRGRSGKRSGWKKAYVTLAKGDDIDFLKVSE